MSLSALTCPHCVGSFLVDSSMAGQEALCPNCKGMVLIPPIGAAPPSVTPPDPTTQFACPVCFQAFAALASMAGQRVMCPHCGSTVMVPRGLAPETTSPPPPPVSAPVSSPPVPSPPAPPPPRLDAQVVGAEKASPSVIQAEPKPAPINRPIPAPPATPTQDQPPVGDLPVLTETTKSAPAAPRERPVRKLSPAERARYRLIKNVVVLTICAAVLAALFFALRYAPILKEL